MFAIRRLKNLLFMMLLAFSSSCLAIDWETRASYPADMVLFGKPLYFSVESKPLLSKFDLDYRIPKHSDVFLSEQERRTVRGVRRLAITDNDPEAQAELGDFYFDGYLVEQNPQYAIAWYAVAADNGSSYANYMMSIFFQEGEYVPQDIARSVQYQQNAHGLSASVLAMRQVGQRSLDTTSYFYDTYRGIEWLQRAAVRDDVAAQERLGDLYSDSYHVAVNPMAALRWYGRAAGNASAYAEYSLARMYMQGIAVTKDLTAAFGWMHKAASQGFPPAQAQLGQMYMDGVGVSRNYELGYVWLKLAEDDLNHAASFNTQQLNAVNDVGRSLWPAEKMDAVKLHQQLEAKFPAAVAHPAQEDPMMSLPSL